MSVTAQHFDHPLLAQTDVWLRGLLPSGRLGKYILLFGLIGTAILAYAVGHAPLVQPGTLAGLFILAFIIEWAPIRLTGTPLRGASLSVSAAFAFAALMMFGISGSIIVNMGSALAYCLKEKRPFFKRWFTTAALVNSSAATGLVFRLAGGGSPMVMEAQSLVAAGFAAGAYFLANSSLISGAISLQTGRPFRSVLANWQWLFLQMLTSLAVGLVMALAYSGLGSPSFLLVALLLVLPWYSIYFYVQKSRQVSEQNEMLTQANVELEHANHALDLQLRSLRALHHIGVSLNSTRSLQDILTQILNTVRGLSGADTSAIFLYQEGRQLCIAGQVGLSSEFVEAAEMALGGFATHALRGGSMLVMDKHNYQAERLSTAAVRESIRAVAALPLSVSGEVVGGLEVCFKSEHAFLEEQVSLLQTIAEQAAVAIHNAQLVERIHESYLSTIQALAATVEAKDAYTRGHSEGVRVLAVATGRQLGFSNHQIELLNLGALFHDIGKIGIPEAILEKPSQLTQTEWQVMMEHPIIGEKILGKVPVLAEVLPIVRHHHERFDGKGYPDGICIRDNLLAAVIGVCDAFQAMTSDRSYRGAFLHWYAFDEIRRGSGTQFVPEVVEAFIAAVESQDIENLSAYQFEPTFLLGMKLPVAQPELLGAAAKPSPRESQAVLREREGAK